MLNTTAYDHIFVKILLVAIGQRRIDKCIAHPGEFWYLRSNTGVNNIQTVSITLASISLILSIGQKILAGNVEPDLAIHELRFLKRYTLLVSR